MKRTKGVRKLLRLALCLCVLLCLAAPAVGAIDRVDVGRECSLTLDCRDGQSPLPGVSFRLYRVGDLSEDVRFTLSGDFADYPVSLAGLDVSGWMAAANTLAAHAAADGLKPLAAGETDARGLLSFEKLSTGLYLIVGDRHTAGNTVYRFAPFLTCLPGLGEDGVWSYDVTLVPKHTKEEETSPGGGGNTRSLSVVKHWEDGENREERPESVTVELLKNGSGYDTVVLNEGNYWRYTWRNLSASSDWLVVERDVPDGYTVTYSEGNTVVTVTNAYTTDIPDEPIPGGSWPNTPGTPGTPDEPGVDIPDDPVPGGGLPQTGQLWWPVPILAVLGVLVFSLGWYERFRRRAE